MYLNQRVNYCIHYIFGSHIPWRKVNLKRIKNYSIILYLDILVNIF